MGQNGHLYRSTKPQKKILIVQNAQWQKIEINFSFQENTFSL